MNTAVGAKALTLGGKISLRTVWGDHFYLELKEMLVTNRTKQKPKGKFFFSFLPKETEKHALRYETQRVT